MLSLPYDIRIIEIKKQMNTVKIRVFKVKSTPFIVEVGKNVAHVPRAIVTNRLTSYSSELDEYFRNYSGTCINTNIRRLLKS